MGYGRAQHTWHLAIEASAPASAPRSSVGAVSPFTSPGARQQTRQWDIPQREEVWTHLGTPLSPPLLGGCLIKLVPRLRLWETSAVQRGQKLSRYPSAKLWSLLHLGRFGKMPSPLYNSLFLSLCPFLHPPLSLSLLPYPYFMESSGGMKLSETNPLLDI